MSTTTTTSSSTSSNNVATTITKGSVGSSLLANSLDEKEISDNLELDRLAQFDLGELDITTSEIDFSSVNNDLSKFEQDSLVGEALKAGVDLREYSKNIDSQLNNYELACIQDYLSQSNALAELHLQIKSCDSILGTMESMLSSFQQDLGSISSEISHLQNKSISMNIKLRNRKAAESSLASFINNMFISDSLTLTIIEGAINESYINQLKLLDQRIKYCVLNNYSNTRAAQDVIPTITRLKLKAIQRTREYLLTKFNDLRKPQTNVQIKQQQLLKYKYFYEFLLYHTDNKNPLNTQLDTDIAQEIRLNYYDTMSKIYYSKFKKYLQEMKKLQIEPNNYNTVEKHDLIGIEEGKGSGGIFTHKKSKVEMDMLFILTTERERILTDQRNLNQNINDNNYNSDYIIPHIADKIGQKLSFERIFQTAMNLLIDTATTEYDFVVEFFGEKVQDNTHLMVNSLSNLANDNNNNTTASTTNNNDTNNTTNTSSTSDRKLNESTDSAVERGREQLLRSSRDKSLFNQIFNKTVALFYELLENYILTSNDALSLLLLIRIVCQSNNTMQMRRVHSLDSFFDRLNMLLWPKFKQIFDLNVDSIAKIPFAEAKINSTTTGKGPAAPQPFKPFFLIQRYSDYTCALLKLNRDYQDEILVTSLRRLRIEVEKLLTRSAGRIKEPKLQIIWLIQNYNIIINTLRITGLQSEDLNTWNNLLQNQISLYVEEELSEKFPKLIQFVKQTEFNINNANNNNANSGNPDDIKLDLFACENIVKHFAKYWREGIEQINNTVKTNFSDIINAANNNPANTNNNNNPNDSDNNTGTEILKQVLVQLVLYYQRFQDIVKKYCKNKPNITKDIVPIPNIMFEIKKYSKGS